MNREFIKHDLTFNNGDTVKHKSTDFKMVVVQTEKGYGAPYAERIICSFWHPTEMKFVDQKFRPIEIEKVAD